ncbi:roadblock/LC7 domain-containing protein [Streptomyces sp. NPDC050204]|uniref:roadblock/LC7 domain-containing protein n=1 Tax=Streptomyces sp. NPDC050204 TaxID=3155514 RepID=UPI003426D8C6
MNSPLASDLSWILNDLVKHPGALHAVVLSADGLVVNSSEAVERDLADTVSAASSGLQSLSRKAAVFVSDQPTPWQQTVIQYGAGYLFIIAAGNGTFLAASAEADVNIVAFTYKMAEVIKRMGTVLGVGTRQAEQG